MMRILALAGDAGGARALAPVIARLRPRVTVRCLAYAAASEIWDREGFEPAPVRSVALDGTDRLLLGTTVGSGQWEPEFIRSAGPLGIRTCSVIDGWGSYRERFRASNGDIAVPDAIAVMDEEMRDHVLAAGLPRDRVFVTGQPALDQLASVPRDRGHVVAVRRSLGVTTDTCVLFVSQPEAHDLTWKERGFDARGVLTDTIHALSAVMMGRSEAASLVVKLHPREMGRPHREVIGSRSVRAILVANDRVPPRDLAVASDLVVGISSMLLLEACLLGTPVISYQPNLRVVDDMLTNRRGWSRPVYRRTDLARALEEELFDQVIRARRRETLSAARVEGRATDRVIELLRLD